MKAPTMAACIVIQCGLVVKRALVPRIGEAGSSLGYLDFGRRSRERAAACPAEHGPRGIDCSREYTSGTDLPGS